MRGVSGRLRTAIARQRAKNAEISYRPYPCPPRKAIWVRRSRRHSIESTASHFALSATYAPTTTSYYAALFTMSKKVIEAANGPNPSPILNNLIVSGDKAYLAGVLGTDATGKLVTGGVKAEAVQALRNAEERLRHAGLDLSDGG